MDDVEEGLSLDERLRRFDESKEKGEDDRLVIWAGVGAGLTNEIMPAAVSVGPSILFLCA
jgi:nitronate monooxygenase